MRRFATVVGVIALVGTACGGGTSTRHGAAAPSTTRPTPLQMVLASSTKVADAHSFRFSLDFSMPMNGAPRNLSATGAIDVSQPLMTMAMDVATLVPVKERKNGTTVDMIFNDQALYMGGPVVASGLHGRHWIRFDLATLSDKTGGVLNALVEQMKDADPRSSTSLLKGASGDPVLIGTEDVRGVAAQHYKVNVELAKAVASLPPKFKESFGKVLDALGDQVMPVDVWLDNDGLPRRMVYELDMSKLAPGLGAGHYDLQTFDFGASVTATLPDPSDTVDSASVG